jgi:hypothetical protein
MTSNIVQILVEEEIDEKDVEIVQLGNEVYRFIQKSKDTNGAVKDFKFKIHKSGSLSAARQSILAAIIRKKLNLRASNHIEIVDDSEGYDPEE